MGFFSFFKKEKKIVEVGETEVVSRGELFSWLERKKKKHCDGEEEFLEPIKKLIEDFVAELEAEIQVLENIDFDIKKVDLRVKSIVKENLRNYIGYLQKMMGRLGEIEKRKNLVERINFVFDDFNKRSEMSFQKVTFLVGKEIQATKDSVRKFLKDLEIVLKNNAKDFKEFEVIEFLEKDVLKFNQVEKDKEKIFGELKVCEEKVDELEKDLERKEEKIVDLKKSGKFKEEEKKKDELVLKRKEFENKIYLLSDLIDFKILSSFYHKFEKEMKWVKEYKNNFRLGLKNLGFSKLVNLLKDAKLNNPKIEELIEGIKVKEQEILDFKIDDFGLFDLNREVQQVKSKVEEVEREKIIQEKKLKSLDEELEKILGVFEKELGKIDVEIQ